MSVEQVSKHIENDADFSDDDGEMEEMLKNNEIPKDDQDISIPLSADQKARAERNKMKAVALKKSRLQIQPYNKGTDRKGNKDAGNKKLVDGGGGFFIEEEEEEKPGGKLESLPPPLLPSEQPHCLECQEIFAESYLFRTFDHEVCDSCKNCEKDGPHELITKTDAKKEFLLKDSDFEKGEREEAFEPLKFILRKNPHNPRWGDMKLFLRVQVEARALKVWGSEEALEKEHETRQEKQVQAKGKRYEKKMKELRRAVRSSLFAKDLSSHEHNFGEETYHEEKDEYSKTCSGCGHVQTYEKM